MLYIFGFFLSINSLPKINRISSYVEDIYIYLYIYSFKKLSKTYHQMKISRSIEHFKYTTIFWARGSPHFCPRLLRQSFLLFHQKNNTFYHVRFHFERSFLQQENNRRTRNYFSFSYTIGLFLGKSHTITIVKGNIYICSRIFQKMRKTY